MVVFFEDVDLIKARVAEEHNYTVIDYDSTGDLTEEDFMSSIDMTSSDESEVSIQF